MKTYHYAIICLADGIPFTSGMSVSLEHIQDSVKNYPTEVEQHLERWMSSAGELVKV